MSGSSAKKKGGPKKNPSTDPSEKRQKQYASIDKALKGCVLRGEYATLNFAGMSGSGRSGNLDLRRDEDAIVYETMSEEKLQAVHRAERLMGMTLRVFEPKRAGQQIPKKRIYGLCWMPDGSVMKMDSETNTMACCTDNSTGAPLPHEDPENITYM